MMIQSAAKTFNPFKQSIESSFDDEESASKFIKFSRIEKAIKHLLVTPAVLTKKEVSDC